MDAHAVAREKVENGDVVGAEPYFLNALAQKPADVSIVNDFARLVLDVARRRAASGEVDDARDRLIWLEGFVRDRASQVRVDDVEGIVRLADEIEQERRDISPSAAEDSGGQRLPQLLALRKACKDLEIPCERQALMERIKEWEELGSVFPLYPEVDSKPLALALERARSALRALDLIMRIDDLLEAEKKNHCIPEKRYLLQGAAGIVGELVAIKETLPPDLGAAVSERVQTVERSATTLSDEERESTAKHIWDSFSEEIGNLLQAARDWHAPSHRGAPSDKCHTQLDRLASLRSQVVATAARLGNEIEGLARELAREIEELIRVAAAEQQHAYDTWALSQIESAMTRAEKHAGIIDDEKKIGSALQNTLGEVDTRLLSFEVNRAFSEVFEHFFSRLDKPSDSKDFNKPSTRLHTLMKMAEAKKRPLSEF